MSTDPTKINLRKFSLRAAGGYRGRGAAAEFARDLLACFGWEDVPEGADVPSKLSVVAQGKRTSRTVALRWPDRGVLIDVTKRDVMLDFAWKELGTVCLQINPPPQYVLLTNLRELHLYDLARDREEPRLAIPLDQLAKYSEAFPFLRTEWSPGDLPKIINVEKVSKKVADLVAQLYRSLKAVNPDHVEEVIRFTLQCIIAMFAEDIGLLPQEYFTTLLYEGRANGDAEARLADLFRVMSTKKLEGREIPYFNGGLFNTPVTVPLGTDQLRALTKAAEANWKHVDPHIFGSVFQGIMDDDERHAQGAHYTAREDIMRVVGPTIVEPWQERIHSAKTLTEMDALLKDLGSYRVLDPACGSGNFLYVAYRELHRLETELLCRMHEEFVSIQKKPRGWASVIRTTNFFGIDINQFAVELAKTTLNMAKKIAFEERKDTVAELYGQIEMEIDRSLPLDNLDENIRCEDALFVDWPAVEAIVGNPPFLGGEKAGRTLGATYMKRLRKAYPGVPGRADFCTYWLRLSHDHLPHGGRAGLVGTNSIRENNSRKGGTDYIVDTGGTITDAVSSRQWPGDAVVFVSMVNWTKGPVAGPHRLIVEDVLYRRTVIFSHLQLHADVRQAVELKPYKGATSQGIILGTSEFEVSHGEARAISADSRAKPFVKAITSGDDVLGGALGRSPGYVIDMSACERLADAEKAGAAFHYLRENVKPVVDSKGASYKGWSQAWWRPWRPRAKFLRRLIGKQRVLACSRYQARPIFFFLGRTCMPTEQVQLFAFDDDYSFGIVQSTMHWRWAVARGSKIKEDTRYLADVWSTFAWPQEVSEAQVVEVARLGRQLRHVRDRLMADNDWSLRDLHQAADSVAGHPLKDAQAALDEAVAAAYGIPPGQEITEFLLELNLCLAEDEADGHAVQGPGLPKGLDPKDPRWFSEDCIEPPPLE